MNNQFKARSLGALSTVSKGNSTFSGKEKKIGIRIKLYHRITPGNKLVELELSGSKTDINT